MYQITITLIKKKKKITYSVPTNPKFLLIGNTVGQIKSHGNSNVSRHLTKGNSKLQILNWKLITTFHYGVQWFIPLSSGRC